MTDQSTNLRLPYLLPAQAQKHVTVNEGLRRLDALVQTAVESRSASTEPASPSDGAVWLLPPGKTGTAWGGYANGALAYYRDGAWEQLQPKAGWRAFVRDEGVCVVFDGAAWRLETVDLASPGEIGATTPGAATVTELNDGPLAGFRNVIINGGFDVWQRGTSFTGSSNAYGPDRFLINASGATLTVSRQTFTLGQTDVPGNPQYSCRVDVTSADDNAGLFTYIEDVASLSGEEVTFSFYAKTASGTHTVALKAAQIFGSGGSSTVSTGTLATFTLTTSWQRFTHTFTLPSVSGKTRGDNNYVRLEITNGANEVWDMDCACWQLEPGPVATPFERRPIATELALCQRYFERIETVGTDAAILAGFCDTTTNAKFSFHYREKRAVPTVAFSDATHFGLSVAGTDQTFTVISADLLRTNYCRVSGDVASGLTAGHGCILRSQSASGYIDIDAELV